MHVDLSPLMLAAIGLLMYGVGCRWTDSRRRAQSRRTSPDQRTASADRVTSTVPDGTAGSETVDESPESPGRTWWRDPVGVTPIAVGLAMIVGSAGVERAFGTVVSIAASWFLPTR